jgi:hypothetical protein
MFALMVFTLIMFAPVARAAAPQPEWWRNGGPRMRPQDDRTTVLLEQGQMRSPTLRALVTRVEASDVFVYIASSHRLNSHLAGSLQWMTTAGPYRYVRVTIDPTLPADLMIATLGHELQHVSEVIDDPSVVDERTLVGLYKRIGTPSRVALMSGWETVAAQDAGQRVRRELGAMPTTTAANLAGRPKP